MLQHASLFSADYIFAGGLDNSLRFLMHHFLRSFLDLRLYITRNFHVPTRMLTPSLNGTESNSRLI